MIREVSSILVVEMIMALRFGNSLAGAMTRVWPKQGPRSHLELHQSQPAHGHPQCYYFEVLHINQTASVVLIIVFLNARCLAYQFIAETYHADYGNSPLTIHRIP